MTKGKAPFPAFVGNTRNPWLYIKGQTAFFVVLFNVFPLRIKNTLTFLFECFECKPGIALLLFGNVGVQFYKNLSCFMEKFFRKV